MAAQPHLVPHRELPAARVWRNTHVLPQVFWADGARDVGQIGRSGSATEPRPTSRTAHLFGLQAAVTYPRPPVDPVFRKGSRRVDVELNNVDAGFLVLSYTYYPTWRASIDGRAAVVHRVNGMIAGVEVPAGAKHLSFEYFEKSLPLAAGAFAAGAALLMLILFIQRVRRRGNRPAAIS